MLLIKIYYKVNKILTLLYYKINYCNKLKFSKINFRKRFNVSIGKKGIVRIGNGCFFNNDCSINCLDLIEIGEDCIFGENVKIYDHNHSFKENRKIKEQPMRCDSIHIGKNVWIGSNVIILAGTYVGDNSVISAGVTIHGKIPENTIVKRGADAFYFEAIKR